MSLFLKFIVTVALVMLFVSGLLSVLSALFSRVSADPLLRLEDLAGDNPEYDESEVLSERREADRAVFY
jgi:hypothetical protein